MMTLSMQRKFTFNSLLEVIRGSKCCVIKVRQYISEVKPFLAGQLCQVNFQKPSSLTTNAMLKKASLCDEDCNQIEPRTGFLQFYVRTKKVCRCFASFSSEHELFTLVMYMRALIRP